MAFGANDVQTAGCQHLVMRLLPLVARTWLRASSSGILAQGPQFGVEATAEHDVGTTAGHIGGDGYRARATGLCDDMRLALMLFGIQHFVLDVGLLQDA